MTDRRKFITLYLIIVTVISVAVIGLGSWLIVPPASGSANGVQITGKTDTSAAFTRTAQFAGMGTDSDKDPAKYVTLTDFGRQIYGDIEVEITYNSGKYHVPGIDQGCQSGGEACSDPDCPTCYKIITDIARGRAAGYHYYKIVDKTTGQIIANNHELVISPANVTVSETEGTALGFVGDEFSWTVELYGIESTANAIGSYTYSHTIGTEDFGTNGKNDGISSTKEITTAISTDSITQKIDKNNYKPEGVTFSASIEVLATCYFYDKSASYYATLNTAIDDTVNQNGTIVAMQSFTYNNINYTANPNATAGAGTVLYKHEITGTHEVGSNVKLLIPFRATTKFNASEEVIKTNDQYAQDSDNDDTIDDDGHSGATWSGSEGDGTQKGSATCVNEVVLNGTLNVSGSVDIAGLTGMPQPGVYETLKPGMTSGKHAAITLTGGEKSPANAPHSKSTAIKLVSSSAELNVRGYITENSDYTWIDAQQGTIQMPFVVYSYGGGGATVAMFKGNGKVTLSNLSNYANSNVFNVAPFHTFDMPNIQVELHCQYTANIYGLASLFTNGALQNTIKAQYNLTSVKIFGQSNALFNMSDGEAVFDYNPDNTAAYKYTSTTANYYPNLLTPTKITLNGTTVSGDMAMVVNVPILGDISVSLINVKFPVSHKIKLYLTGDHDYTFSTQFKFLPGSELHIKGGANVNIPDEKGIMFYQSIGSYGLYNDREYPSTKLNEPAVCKIYDGTLNVQGSIGGIVQTMSANSVLNLAGADSLIMTETEGVGTYVTDMGMIYNASLTFTFTPKETVSRVAQGLILVNQSVGEENKPTAPMTSATPPAPNYTDLAPSNYTGTETCTTVSDSKTALAAWRPNSINVTLDAMSGTVNHTNPVTTPASGYLVSDLPDPTRTHYDFDHWCSSNSCDGGDSCNIPANLYQDTTLYANWTKITYTLKYEFVADGFSPVATLPANDAFVVDGNSVNLTVPKDASDNGYSFVGWYTDKSCQEQYKINTAYITSAQLISLLNGGDSVTLYGKWVEKSYTFTFDIAEEYDYMKGDIDKLTVTYAPNELANATWPTIQDYSTQKDKPYYFNYWMYNGQQITQTVAEFVAEQEASGVTEYTITPSVTKKYALTVNASSGATHGTAITYNQTLYLIESQLSTQITELNDIVMAQDSVTGTNKYFTGWTSGSEAITSLEVELFDANKSFAITANFGTKYTITYSGGGSKKGTEYRQPGVSYTLPASEKTGHTFQSWFTAETGGDKVGGANESYTPTADITLYAQWQVNSYTIKVTANNATVTVNGSSVSNNGTVSIQYGTQVTVIVTYSQDDSQSTTIKGTDGTTYNSPFNMPAQDVTINATSTKPSGGCVTPDTLITLADGTLVRVDSLKGDELLLVWNLETGMLDFAPIMFVDSEALEEFEVVRLIFSDGTTVDVIYEHGFWDYDLNKYVYLDGNAADYIGHSFAKQNGDTLERVQLVDVVIETKLTTAWSPVTVGHLCYFVNGMLSMPGGVGGLFNIFEVDSETMTYDYEAIARDIEKYGLYTYEELNALAPLSREMFEAAGGAYLKISIGKGNLTEEELIYMIERYSKYFE